MNTVTTNKDFFSSAQSNGVQTLLYITMLFMKNSEEVKHIFFKDELENVTCQFMIYQNFMQFLGFGT